MESLTKTVKRMTLEDLEADLSKILECPVCLSVPRSGPIPSCSSGHIVCSTCRENLSDCPVCRKPLLDNNVNSVAASLIEKVKHKCKYNDSGCEETDFLMHLENHEKKCPERIITCPYLGCRRRRVQFKNYSKHSLDGGYRSKFMGQTEPCTSQALVDTDEYRTNDLDIEKHCFKIYVSYCKRPILVTFETIMDDVHENMADNQTK